MNNFLILFFYFSQFQVHPGQPHEPGWLGGELDGKVGWFPEAYVEKAADHQVNIYIFNRFNFLGPKISDIY
jgi:hypothetical protein